MRIPMRGGEEHDALSPRAKRIRIWRSGQRAGAKRSYVRRLRQAFKGLIRAAISGIGEE